MIESIEGDGGRLSLVAEKNCVGIAALETLKLLGQPSCGVGLRLRKGLPLGSGMGSSAASAAAAAWAVNALFGAPLGKDTLIYAGLASEAAVSGYHADNVAPALMGGFILIRCACVFGRAARGLALRLGRPAAAVAAVAAAHAAASHLPKHSRHTAHHSPPLLPLPHAPPRPHRSCDPLDIQRLTFAGDLWFVLVNPRFEAPTAEMRAVLPKEIPMKKVGASGLLLAGGCAAAGKHALG